MIAEPLDMKVSSPTESQSYDPGFHYLMMKTSLERFGVICSELKVEQLPQVTKLATNARQLQRKVLSSPEASQVHLTPQELDTAYAELKKRFDGEDNFRATLTANQLDPEGLKSALREELLCEAILTYVTVQVPKVDEAQALDYYQAHVQKFEQPDRRYARHILITVNDDFAENTLDQVETRIADIHQQLLRKGDIASHFGWFAKRYSECPSAMNDGELGWVEKNTLFAELDQVLFAMKPGEMSEPIATEAGLHILFCQQITPTHTVPFEQAKEKIQQGLYQHSVKVAQKNWLAGLPS